MDTRECNNPKYRTNIGYLIDILERGDIGETTTHTAKVGEIIVCLGLWR